jgi:MYXO-CTERM domain-containing protein
MACVRGWWAALALAPAILLADGAASADPLTAEALDLPHGIHLGRNGRYYQDVCDHAYAFPCLAKRLLPETYAPPIHRPLAGNAGGTGSYCACGSMSPCGGGGTSPPAGAMTPTNVLAAYQIPSSSSAGGKIVALIDMPDQNAFSDVNVYRKAFGIPELPACSDLSDAGVPDPNGGTPCFAAVDENGNPTTTVTDCESSDGETGLDTDMVSAACPDCSILLVQMTSADEDQGPSDLDFVDSVRTAIKLGASATSISFGGPEFKDPTGQDYTKPGHLVLAAAGDEGYLNGGAGSPSYPASAPDVLGVGGTTLKQSGSTYSEVVWDDARGGAGGSGCSTEFAMPAFQTTFLAATPNAFGTCTKRASVDVAAAAEFEPGAFEGAIAEYDKNDGWVPSVGTSAASPMVGAILTRLGLTDAVSSDLGWVYTNIAAFNDITSGTNDLDGTCDSVMCKAGPGYDGPTGVGSPNGANLEPLAQALNPQDAGEAADGGETGGDGGSSVNHESPTSSKSGCGCRTTSTPTLDGLSLLAAAGLVGLALRRRRRS